MSKTRRELLAIAGVINIAAAVVFSLLVCLLTRDLSARPPSRASARRQAAAQAKRDAEQPPRPDEAAGGDADPHDRWHRLTPGSVAGTWRTSDGATWSLWLYRHPAMPDNAAVWAQREQP